MAEGLCPDRGHQRPRPQDVHDAREIVREHVQRHLAADARQRLRAQVSVTRGGRTELESLIARTRDLPAPGLDLPADVKLPGSLVFG